MVIGGIAVMEVGFIFLEKNDVIFWYLYKMIKQISILNNKNTGYV